MRFAWASLVFSFVVLSTHVSSIAEVQRQSREICLAPVGWDDWRQTCLPREEFDTVEDSDASNAVHTADIKSDLFDNEHKLVSNKLHSVRNESISTTRPSAGANEQSESARKLLNVEIIRSTCMSDAAVHFMYDYAAFDAGGRIVEASRKIHGVKAIQSNADSYMMTRCLDDTWAIVALPEQILLEYVAFESRELFSSFYRKIAIMVSGVYPTDEWILLAVVELSAIRSREVFDLRPICTELRYPACWVTHVKFEVVSYHLMQNAKFCTLTRFQVFGSTLLQGLRSKFGHISANKSSDMFTQNETSPLRSETVVGDEMNATTSNLTTVSPSSVASQSNKSMGEVCSTQVIRVDLISENQSEDDDDQKVDPEQGFGEAYRETLRLLLGDEMFTSSRPTNISRESSLPQDTSMIEIQNSGEEFIVDSIQSSAWPGQTMIALPFSGASPQAEMPILLPEQPEDHPDVPKLSTTLELLKVLIEATLKMVVDTQSEQGSTEEKAPPLLALADKVSWLETLIAVERNSTLTQLSVLDGILQQMISQASNLRTMKTLLHVTAQKTLWNQYYLITLLENNVFERLLATTCADLLAEFNWNNKNGKRQVCLAARILSSGSNLTKINELQRARRLLGDVQNVNLRLAIEIRLKRLQLSLGVPEVFSAVYQERLSRLESVQEANSEYRELLKEQVGWFGVRQVVLTLAYAIKSVETSLYNVGSLMSLVLDNRWPINNSLVRSYSRCKEALASLVKTFEADPILTWFQILLLEGICICSIGRVLMILLAVLVVDNALRTREMENAINDLQTDILFPEIEKVSTRAVASTGSSPRLLQRWKAFSAPPSATRPRIGGGLTAKLVHSLEPYLRRRSVLQETEHLLEDESSSTDDASPPLADTAPFLANSDTHLRPVNVCESNNNHRISWQMPPRQCVTSFSSIRRIGETLASLRGVSATSLERRQPQLPRQFPTLLYTGVEPQSEVLHTHSAPPPTRQSSPKSKTMSRT